MIIEKIKMWFYLYLITTSYHFQYGLSLIGLSSNYEKDYSWVCQNYQYSDPMKFVIIYQFPEKMSHYPILEIVTNNTYSKYVDWYKVDIDEIEKSFHKFGITFKEITIKEYIIQHVNPHDEF